MSTPREIAIAFAVVIAVAGTIDVLAVNYRFRQSGTKAQTNLWRFDVWCHSWSGIWQLWRLVLWIILAAATAWIGDPGSGAFPLVVAISMAGKSVADALRALHNGTID